jgi:Retrotransposon gag protein
VFERPERRDNTTEPMASIVGYPSAQAGATITLKAAHPDPFSGGAVRARIFIQQVDNKIADAAGASDGRKIRYAVSLLRGQAAEWASTHTDDEGYSTFQLYTDFRKDFMERFTEPNPVGTAMEKLLSIKQGKMGIQEYTTKALNLTQKAQVGTQAAKALVFRGLHPRDQDRIMLANSIFTEENMNEESLPTYLRRITTLLRREEVRRGGWQAGQKGQAENIHPRAIWGHGGDPMELDALTTAVDKGTAKETCKYFKCGKIGHIRRFCRSEGTLVSIKTSENGDVLAMEGYNIETYI